MHYGWWRASHTENVLVHSTCCITFEEQQAAFISTRIGPEILIKVICPFGLLTELWYLCTLSLTHLASIYFSVRVYPNLNVTNDLKGYIRWLLGHCLSFQAKLLTIQKFFVYNYAVLLPTLPFTSPANSFFLRSSSTSWREFELVRGFSTVLHPWSLECGLSFVSCSKA